ncbi:hypothetical protein CVT25_000103 [Psilocybe cyanescens]|uniref:Uncharacterized protein n=1 Tax=Psilocybe cyanescens TaxID=93625 RepID=A0A409XQ70_PSICY|nr:hypothetical protein CVT25_000103 [Psilocybe cyanescens]
MALLPHKVPERLQQLAHIVSAYNICLRLKKSLQLANNNSNDLAIGHNLVYVQVLDYLMHYVPTNLGLKHIALEISKFIDDSAVLAVGKMDHIQIHKLYGVSHCSFARIQDMNNAILQHQVASQSPFQAKKYVRLAFVQDRYRCVVTRVYDVYPVMTIQELVTKFEADLSARMEYMQCAHIFPVSTNASIQPGPEEVCLLSIFTS